MKTIGNEDMINAAEVFSHFFDGYNDRANRIAFFTEVMENQLLIELPQEHSHVYCVGYFFAHSMIKAGVADMTALMAWVYQCRIVQDEESSSSCVIGVHWHCAESGCTCFCHSLDQQKN